MTIRKKMALLTLTVLLGACSSTPMKTAEVAQQETTTPATTPEMKPVTETETQRVDRIVRVLAAKSIFFDYDNFVVKPEYINLLKQDYELMKSVPKVEFRLEGNADERGSSEYNLSLGQKRAEAVRKALVLMGIPDSQLEAVSYGKEKPRAVCHEEECWSQNRRVDVVKKGL